MSIVDDVETLANAMQEMYYSAPQRGWTLLLPLRLKPAIKESVARRHAGDVANVSDADILRELQRIAVSVAAPVPNDIEWVGDWHE